MHVPVYISSYIHSYLIALTRSWAPRLRGRLLVLTTSHAPLLLEMSTIDIDLSKSPRSHSIAECMPFKILAEHYLFQLRRGTTIIVFRSFESCSSSCVYPRFRSGSSVTMPPTLISSWDSLVSQGETTKPEYHGTTLYVHFVRTIWDRILLFTCTIS